MKKAISLLLALLIVLGALPAMVLSSSAEDTVALRNYTNVAYGKKVKTGNDSSFNGGSYVTNGNASETGVDISWGSFTAPNANCYVIIDLESVYNVGGVAVANHPDTGRWYCWEAYASVDQSAWTLIAKKSSSAPSVAGGYYFETPLTEARYVKVVGTYDSANSGYHFGEVEVYSPDVYTLGDTVAANYTGNGYTATLSEDGTLTVSGSGEVGSASSSSADYPWYPVRTAIRKVVLDEAVTSIGANAFADCTNLHSVYLPGETALGGSLFTNAKVTKLETLKKYYTDLYVDVLGTSNESKVRFALADTYGGVQWKTLENDSVLYVYGCGPIVYPNRDSVPWFNYSGRGSYEKVIVGDAISDIGMYSFSADAYGKLSEIVLGASVQQFKYQSMAYIPLASLTFLAPITYYGHYTTTGNKYSGTLEVTLASGQTSADLISKQDGYNGTSSNGNSKLWEADFTSVNKYHVEWIDDTTGKAVFACYVADGQTPVFPVDTTYVLDGVTYEFTAPATEPITQDTVFHLSSTALTTFNVRWVRESTGALLYEEEIAYGLVPEYNGPTRIVEDGNVYVATVPSAQPATEDVTYVVPFTQLPKYTITWINGNTNETVYETLVSETLTPVFEGTVPADYTDGDVTYTALLPAVSEATGDATYVINYYADYDTANYPTVYPSGINFKLLDEETLYIYGTGEIPTYESSGGADAPWAQYRSTVKKIIISDGITKIGSCALRDYTALEEIVLGKDIREFSYASFAIDYALDKITFLGNITYYGHQCFSGMSRTLVVTQASGQTHDSLKDAQAYGGSVPYGNNQLFDVTEENYRMVKRIVARFVDGRTGDTLFITSLASGSVPYFAGTMPGSYTEDGIVYTPVMPELTAITESTTYTITYAHEHAYGDYTVTTPATFEHDGAKTRTCLVCGEVDSVVIPKAILGAHTGIVTGEKNGKKTATFIGSIKGEDLDFASLDYIELTLSFYQGGEKINEKTVKVHNIYTTLTGIASVNATAVSQGIEFVENANYVFGVTVNGIPEGEYTLTITEKAILGENTQATYTADYTFDV